MTSVTGTTTGTATVYNSMQSGSGTATDRTQLGKDDFLHLLVKQLQYQDPSAPMDTSQIMQQTASLSSVQTMQQMIDLQQEQFGLQMRVSASGFVGQTVSYVGADGEAATGVVTAASFAKATPELTIDGKAVSLDSISGITKAATASSAASSTSSTSSTSATPSTS